MSRKLEYCTNTQEIGNRISVANQISGLKKKNLPLITQKRLTLEMIAEKYNYIYKIYTDGSIINKIVGFGYYDPQEKISYSGRLKPGFTIMSAEIVAIAKAIEYVNSKNITNVTIFSDSKSACTLLHNLHTDNALVVDLINQIIKSNISKVQIQWIPGHINLLGNDKADEAA